MDESGQIPYWVGNPPEGIVDPDDLRPKVITGLRGRIPAVLVNNAVIAAKILRPWIANAEVEYKTVMYLNTKLRLIGMENVSKGTLDATIWSPREIFIGAVRMRAASIITAHNHPSGDPKPSTYDDDAYRKIVAAGDVMGIKVMDSLILGRETFYCYSSLEEASYD
jgi:DNA repair protein RadC